MLLCLISWIIITNIGCTSKISSLTEEKGSNVVYAGEWKYLNNLMLIGRRRRESYISCSQSPIQNNMTLKGGIQAGYFRKLAEHVAMQLCVELCCEDKGCDVAFMTGKSCYGVQCFNEELCRAFPAKRKVNDPVLISHVTFKGEKVVPKEQAKGKLQCVSTRIKIGSTLRGGLKAGNFTDVGIVEDPKVCVNLCCVSEQCNVAMMINERCFLVSCFSTKLCQMTRSLTPLYMSSLAYVQRKPLTGKKDKGNVSLSYESSDSQLVCKNSKIFYNSTLKGGYHAGNYTNFGIVPNISACIRWCCGNRDCDAAFMLENNCFAVACRNPDDCLPVHAKSSSSSAALKPRISYITSRSEEVSILEDVSSGGICHAGIVSYDVTLRGGSNAGKFTPHGVVNNMKTCIFKCCQSEGCNVAMMLKDSCFTVVCDSDEKCEKKQTPISSHFNPRIAYVFRDKVSKSKKTAPKEKTEQSYHHETLKHKKKMLLIQQLHALTSPHETSILSSEDKYNKISSRLNSLSDDATTIPMSKLKNTYTTTSKEDTISTKSLTPVKQIPYVYNANKNTSEIKHTPKTYLTYSKPTSRTFIKKYQTLKSPIYDFLRGNFDVNGKDRLSVTDGVPGRMLNVLPFKKVTKIFSNTGDNTYNKGLAFNTSRITHPPSKVFTSTEKIRYNHPPLYSYPMTKTRNNINSFIWNGKMIKNYQSPYNIPVLNTSNIPLNLSGIQSKHRIQPYAHVIKRPNITAADSQISNNKLLNNSISVRNHMTTEPINVTYNVENDDKIINSIQRPNTIHPFPSNAKLKSDAFDPIERHSTTNVKNITNQYDISNKIITNDIIPSQNVVITNTNNTDDNTRNDDVMQNISVDTPDNTSEDANLTNTSPKDDHQSIYIPPMYTPILNNSLDSDVNVTSYDMPIDYDSMNNITNATDDVGNVEPFITTIKIGKSDPTCFRSKAFYNVTLRGGYDSGKFRDRGKMKDVVECATLCCHLNKCDLVMMLLNRCFSVDCKNTRLCESVPAKSPIFSPTICYVSHV